MGGRQIALGHNGNLINAAELASEAGVLPGTVFSASDLVAELNGLQLATMGEELSHDDVEQFGVSRQHFDRRRCCTDVARRP